MKQGAMEEDIVITGFSAYFPQADHLVEFKEKLYGGVDMVTEDDARWPPGHLGLPRRHGKIRELCKFDAQFFGVHARQAHVMDPQMRLLLETSYEAILDAGYDPDTLRGGSVGVFVGMTECETRSVLESDVSNIDGYETLGCSRSMFANRISFCLDFHGPSMTIDSACSSSLSALNEAVLALRSRRCEAAIVGGSCLTLDPASSLMLMRLGVLSKDGKCKAFDSLCDGYVRSEAVGALFLQRASAARRVYAKVINVRANEDGYKAEGITCASGRLQEQLLGDIYAEAGIDPRQVGYVEAHGSGTNVGDPQELGAIASVFCKPGRKRPLKIGSVKTNVGHTEAASGIVSVAKVILAFETGIIAPNLHFKEPNPRCPSLLDGSIEVVNVPTPLPEGPVGISSYGFGGANVHVILESDAAPHRDHVDTTQREKPELPRLVLLAGRSEDSLVRCLDRVEAEGPYPDSAYALLNRVGQRSVRKFPYRGFLIAPVDGSGNKAVKMASCSASEKRSLWFVFPGTGCQWNGMATQMMQFEPFARSIQKSHDFLQQYDVDLIRLLTIGIPETKRISCTSVSIVAMQVALVDTLHSLGIRADGIVGHSTGETSSAYADGCLSAEEALQCAYWRGRCVELQNLPKGAMAAVGMTWDEARRRCPDGVIPACHNAEDSVTISGSAEAVADFVAELREENIFVREVDSMGVAYHSKHVGSVEPELREVLEKVIPQPKRRSKRWISTSIPENRWLKPAASYCSAEYLVNNFLSPVLFNDALKHVPKDAILIEIAPHGLLQAILRRAVDSSAHTVSLMKRDADNLLYFLTSLGKLHNLGVQMDLSPLYPEVSWPVARGTPNIAHLVSWDHSQTWTVADWKKFPSSSQASEEYVDVDVESNEADKFLCGHVADGRLLFPASGHILLAWKALAKRRGMLHDHMPVILEDITIHQETVLPSSGPVRFSLSVMRLSGEFEIGRDGDVVATGRVRVANEGEKVLYKDPPGRPAEMVDYDLDSADVYKELRLRGYEYSGEFRGILKADLQKPYGKLRWSDNWLTFIDAMIQFSFLSETMRSFVMPVRIESCRIDPKIQTDVITTYGDEGVDVVYSPYRNTCRAGGVTIQGLHVSVAQRPFSQQTPLVQVYRFVPYEDSEQVVRERESSLQDYVELCGAIASRIINCSSNKKQQICHNEDASRDEAKLWTHEQRVLDFPENHGLLSVLRAIEESARFSSLAVSVSEALDDHSNDLINDCLSTGLFQEDPLNHLLDIVLENRSSSKVRILEVACHGKCVLLAPCVLRLLSRYNINLKTAYTVAHPFPTRLSGDRIPTGVRVVAGGLNSGSASEFFEYDLVIIVNGMTGAWKKPAVLAQELSSQCKERGFVLLSHRTALIPAEEFLSSAVNANFHVYSDKEVVSAFKAHGFVLISLKSNFLSTLILFRKIPATFDATKQKLHEVAGVGFQWVPSLKQTVLEYDTKPVDENTWLLSAGTTTSGVVGLVNCLRVETGGQHIRCICNASLRETNGVRRFPSDNAQYTEIFKKDLVMNVYRDGQWGSFRHQTLPAGGSLTTNTEFAFVRQQRPGDLSSFQWCESPLRYSSTVDSNVLHCDVYYASLNSRDVLLATTTTLPHAWSGNLDSSDSALGFEFSGRDKQGRRVMGIVHHGCIATVVSADTAFVWDVPEQWTLEEASTVPVAYTTAYYALCVRGSIHAAESVLIHPGCCDVGQAAAFVALSLGCRVFITVEDERERDIAKNRFPALHDRQIINCRQFCFEDHILDETKGKGVDIVLNVLSKESRPASARCLATNGRYLEIANPANDQINRHSAVNTSLCCKNVHFHSVQCDVMTSVDISLAAEKRRVAQLVTEGVASGAVRPLGTVPFTISQVEEAFRFMAHGKQTGKVVIQIRPEGTFQNTAPALPITVEAVRRSYFYEHKSYVIVGGLGGFGLELAEWMVTRGCRKLLLVSRSGVRSGYQKLCLERWHRIGAEVRVSRTDVSSEDGVHQIVQSATAMGPVGGIFNLAMVLRDALIENQTAEMYEAVWKPKACGTQLLDEVSRHMCPHLDHFVVFSSFSCGRGNAGQTNYGYANSVAERVCERRFADGFPGLAIQWGPIADVGRMSESDVPPPSGTVPQRIRCCLEVLDQLLHQSCPVVSSMVKGELTSKRDDNDRRNILQSVTHILGIKDLSSTNASVTLGELGIDSLMSFDVRQLLERDCDLTLSAQEIRQLTITRLCEMDKQCLNTAAS